MEQNNLLEFDWEKDNDFFPTEAEIKAAQEAAKKDEDLKGADPKEPKEKEPKEPKAPEKKKEDELEDDDFSDFAPKVEEDDDTPPKTDEPTESVHTSYFKDAKEKGFFKHVEIEEDEDIDEDRLAELQELDYETEISTRIKNWATEELDEDAQAFIKFKKDGGKTEDFLRTYKTATELPVGDITDEDYQDDLIRYQLANEGWDKDEIEDRLQYLTDTNRKEKTAKKYDLKVREAVDKKKEDLLKQTELLKKQAVDQENTFKSTIKDFLQETDELEGFKISKDDKVKLFNFLTKREHKVSETKSITGFQKKLAEVFQDTDKMILLAKLISTDFDMSDFEKKTITKKTRDIKSNLEQRKNLRPTGSGSSSGGSSLAELF
jgi:hypothetical protein